MNKNDLVGAVASNAGLSKGDAGKAVDEIFKAITDALKEGDSVRLIGFGTFGISHRAARQGRNPSTGQPIDIPAAKLPTFKAGKALKEAVK